MKAHTARYSFVANDPLPVQWQSTVLGSVSGSEALFSIFPSWVCALSLSDTFPPENPSLVSPLQTFAESQSSRNAYLTPNANYSYQKRHAVKSKFGDSILPECSLDPNRSRVAGWHTGGLWRISWVRGKTKMPHKSSKQAMGPEISQSVEHEQLQSTKCMRVCPRYRHVCKQECTRSHTCHTQQSESEREWGKKDGEGGVDAVQGGGRSCGALRWIDGGDGGGEKA